MAYTAPSTVSTGDLITAAKYNAEVVANAIALKDPPSDNYNVNEGSDYATTGTTFSNVDGTNLSLSITTTGGDVMVHFYGTVRNSSADKTYFNVTEDGTPVAADDGIAVSNSNTAGYEQPISFTRLITGVGAGSHTYNLTWKVSGGTGTLFAGAGTSGFDVHPQFWVREVS